MGPEIRGDGGKLRSVIEHDGVGYNRRVVVCSVVRKRRKIFRLRIDLHDIFSECADIILFPYVAVLAFFQGIRLVVEGFEASEDVLGVWVVS